VLVFRGSHRFQRLAQGTPYAAQQASLAAAGVARDQYGMKSVEVRVKGPGLRTRVGRARAAAADWTAHRADRDVTPIRTTAAVREKGAAF